MELFRAFFVLAITFFTCINATAGPLDGRSYLLFNEYPETNPYEYLAWTLDSSFATNANTNNPGLCMVKSSAGVVPPRSLWMFDVQTDGTYRIYNVDNTYAGSAKRLDVHSDGVTPFLGLIGSTNIGQDWRLFALSDGVSFQMYNQGWKKYLDINGGSTSLVNPLFMNPTPGTNLLGQAWQLADWTPTISLTMTSWITQSSTVTPPPTIVYVGGNQVTVTSSSVLYSTFTVTVTSTQVGGSVLNKRDALTVPTPITVRSTTTRTSTTTLETTLPASTSLVTTGGGTNIVVAFQTSSVTITVSTTISQIASIVAPISTGNGGTTLIQVTSNEQTTIEQTTTGQPTTAQTTATQSTPTQSTTTQSTIPQSTSIASPNTSSSDKIALGVGLGLGLPGTIVALITLWKHCVRGNAIHGINP